MVQVLVVDDDVAVQKLIALVLGSETLSVETASNGASALASLQQGDSPDLIILDLAMPGMDGRTFYGLARDSGYEGPVVICSAFGAERASKELAAQGALDKPFDPDAMLELVSELVAG